MSSKLLSIIMLITLFCHCVSTEAKGNKIDGLVFRRSVRQGINCLSVTLLFL